MKLKISTTLTISLVLLAFIAMPVLFSLAQSNEQSEVLSNLHMVIITTDQVQPAYVAPGGEIIRDAAGNEIWLPHDYNNDGFDTYNVTGAQIADGVYWVSIFLGSENSGWVPLKGVTPLDLSRSARATRDAASVSPATSQPTMTTLPSVTALPTSSLVPTLTLFSTNTFTPTNTEEPTRTPSQTHTFTPSPAFTATNTEVPTETPES